VSALEWPYQQEMMGPPLTHRISPNELTASAEKVGFRGVEIIPLPHMILYQLTIEKPQIRIPGGEQ
jgi:hypothetical protein